MTRFPCCPGRGSPGVTERGSCRSRGPGSGSPPGPRRPPWHPECRPSSWGLLQSWRRTWPRDGFAPPGGAQCPWLLLGQLVGETAQPSRATRSRWRQKPGERRCGGRRCRMARRSVGPHPGDSSEDLGAHGSSVIGVRVKTGVGWSRGRGWLSGPEGGDWKDGRVVGGWRKGRPWVGSIQTWLKQETEPRTIEGTAMPLSFVV